MTDNLVEDCLSVYYWSRDLPRCLFLSGCRWKAQNIRRFGISKVVKVNVTLGGLEISGQAFMTRQFF